MTAPRSAATVVVLRDGAGGLETLMLRRSRRSGFAADAWVFPGGVVDPADARLDAGRWRGIDPVALAPRFRTDPATVLGLHVAAVRETFEEAGLLLGAPTGGPADRAARVAVASDGAAFGAWLEEAALVLDLAALRYFSRWVTPTLESRRYDAAFFVARAPEGQVADHDRVETTEQRWISPSRALAAHGDGRLRLIYPTVRTLVELAEHGDVASVLAGAHARPEVRRIQPHAERAPDGTVRILHPDDPGFPHQLYAG